MKRIYFDDSLFNALLKLSRKRRFMNFIFARLYGCDIPKEVELGKNVHFPVTKDVPDNSVYYNRVTPVIKSITSEERKRLIR